MRENPIYAVMAPSLKSRSKERAPEIAVWFQSEGGARGWARRWASEHVRPATIYKCIPVLEVEGAGSRVSECHDSA